MSNPKNVTFFQVIDSQFTFGCKSYKDPKTGKKIVMIHSIVTNESSLTIPQEIRHLPVVSIELSKNGGSHYPNLEELHLPKTISSLSFCEYFRSVKMDIEPGGIYASADQMIFSADYSILYFVSYRYANQTLRVPKSVTRIEDNVLSSIPFADIIYENLDVEIGEISYPRGPFFENQTAIFAKGALLKLSRDTDFLAVPKDVKTIAIGALNHHRITRLKAPFLPSDEDLGNSAKEIWESLTEFELTDPDYDISLEDLRKYENLACIKVSAEGSRYEAEDGVLYDKKRKRLLFYPRDKKDESFTVKAGTRSIAPLAFRGCKHLVSLSMPDSVTELGEQCICQCPNLETLYLSNEIRVLPNYARGTKGVGVLSNNRKLSMLHLPEKIQYIGLDCLYNTVVSKIHLPEGLLYLSSYALSSSELKEVSLPKSLQMMELGSLVFTSQVTAYEGSAKGLLKGLNLLPDSKNRLAKWTACWVTILGEDGERKGVFYIPGDLKNPHIMDLLALAWDSPSFDYELYLEAYHLMKTGDDKILMGLILLIFGGKEELRPILKKSSKKAGQLLIRHGDLLFFKAFLDLDILSKPSTSALLEECNAMEDPGFAAYLMDYREKHVKTRSFSRFDL